jgi:isochorismate hydrolase
MDFLYEIAPYNKRKARPEPERCALLVIDMQEFFRPMAAPVIEKVTTIIELCRNASLPVIFTRHGHKNMEEDGGMLALWWDGELALYGSPEWQLLKEVAAENGEQIIDKTRYSAFWNTGLHERLQAGGIQEVIITGVMTNCCCETTAREAFMRDYRVFFASDATATVNDDLHCASLKTLAFGFAHVVDTAFLQSTLTP